MQSTSSGMQSSTETIEKAKLIVRNVRELKGKRIEKENDCQTLSSSKNPPGKAETDDKPNSQRTQKVRNLPLLVLRPLLTHSSK